MYDRVHYYVYVKIIEQNIFLVPPDKCLLGCVFLIVEYDRCSDTINEVPTWKQIILEHGGEIEPSYTLRLTHILCQTQKHPLVQQVTFEMKTVFILIIYCLMCTYIGFT